MPFNVGTCTRCGATMTFDPGMSMGTCQAPQWCKYRVRLVEDRDDRAVIIFNGGPSPVNWEGMLCDRCVHALAKFLKGPDDA